MLNAVSIKQPWATFVIHGVKRYEARCWNTRHRGELAIHASKTLTSEAFNLFFQPSYHALLQSLGYRTPYDLPVGKLIGTVELASTTRYEEFDDSKISVEEQGLTKFTTGLWIWCWKNPKPWKTLRTCRGCNGIFPLPQEVLHGHS